MSRPTRDIGDNEMPDKHDESSSANTPQQHEDLSAPALIRYTDERSDHGDVVHAGEEANEATAEPNQQNSAEIPGEKRKRTEAEDEEYERLAKEAKKLKKARRLKETFSLATPEDGKGANINKTDESKFTLDLRHENGPCKGLIQHHIYNPTKSANFDWGSGKHIKALNGWRAQIIERAGIRRRSLPRRVWTVTEATVLENIIRELMNELEHRHQLDWKEVADRFNGRLEGIRAPVGEEIAPTTIMARQHVHDSFGMPEEDHLARTHQQTKVKSSYLYGKRVWSGIKCHANFLPGVRDAMKMEDSTPFRRNPNNPYFPTHSYESSSDDDDDDDDDEDEDESAANGVEQHFDGVVSGQDFVQEHGFAPDPREEALYGPRQMAKDRAGEKWHKGG